MVHLFSALTVKLNHFHYIICQTYKELIDYIYFEMAQNANRILNELLGPFNENWPALSPFIYFICEMDQPAFNIIKLL